MYQKQFYQILILVVFLFGCANNSSSQSQENPLENSEQDTLEDLQKISQENFKKHSMAELTGLDPIKDKSTLKLISKESKRNPEKFLFLNNLMT